ncbi:MAG: cell division protein ZapA [Rikenellaceae bacterium]
MAKQAIKLKVAGKSYALTIDSEKEEMYRLAEREVNQSMSEFERQNFAGFSTIDYMAMTALKFAINNVNNRLQGEVNSDDIATLQQLESTISSYLNDPKRE